MDSTGFAAVPVVDGHIHFPHAEQMDGFVAVMDEQQLARANLVGTPDLQTISHNPALIHFKAHHPQRVYISGALDYTQVWADPARAPEAVAGQIAVLRSIGFDGLKVVEGKPMVRKMLGIPFDGPEYAKLWAALEEQGFPVVFHVADPEEFWDAKRCPDWARTQDLQRAAAFLDAHPSVCFDLTPGVEMYLNFGQNLDAARDFFFKYADRLVYGTDIGASAIDQDPAQELDRPESLGRAWVVRRFLESDRPFSAPEGVGHWLGMDAARFHGIALPLDVLEKMYHANFERVFGPAPAPLNRDAALAELERMAAVIDARAGGELVDSPARRVARRLAET